MDAYQLCEKKFYAWNSNCMHVKGCCKKMLNLLKFSHANCELILQWLQFILQYMMMVPLSS